MQKQAEVYVRSVMKQAGPTKPGICFPWITTDRWQSKEYATQLKAPTSTLFFAKLLMSFSSQLTFSWARHFTAFPQRSPEQRQEGCPKCSCLQLLSPLCASPSPVIYQVAQPETAASELTPSQLPGKHNWTHRHSGSTQLNPSLQLTTANNCVYSLRTRQLEPKHTLLIGHSTEISTWWHTRWVTLRWHQQRCLPVPGHNHTQQT